MQFELFIFISMVFYTAWLIVLIAVFLHLKNSNYICYMLFRDPLTGLANDTKFFHDGSVLLHQRHHRKYALVYFDIDNFKFINDTYGHSYGDQLLQHIAATLKEMLCQGEIFARFSNDYFAILLEYEQDAREIEQLVQGIQLRLRNIHLDPYTTVDIVPSVGIYLIPPYETDLRQIINKVNMARITVKGEEKPPYAFYDEDMRQRMNEQSHIRNDLRIAVEQQQFEVYYQPKFELNGEHLIGLEALIRWNHPQLGFISPARFIPIAEKSGLIVDIGQYVLEQVCKDLRDWKQQGLSLVPVSYNVSRVELLREGLIEHVVTTAKRYDVEAHFIEIELTESTALANLERTQHVLSKFRELGFRVNMDDFGNGYSSLSCLRDIPIDILKLDKAFLINIEQDEGCKQIMQSIIQLAKTLNLKIISEGVETKQQAEFLKFIGCDIAQGYYYAHPMSKANLEMLLCRA